MAQKPGNPPAKPVKTTVIQGKPAQAEMASMRQEAKAQAKAKGR